MKEGGQIIEHLFEQTNPFLLRTLVSGLWAQNTKQSQFSLFSAQKQGLSKKQTHFISGLWSLVSGLFCQNKPKSSPKGVIPAQAGIQFYKTNPNSKHQPEITKQSQFLNP
jgi:hypothetical protein